MAVVDHVKWNATDTDYAWKFPREELSTWTQLIVSESQEAVLIKEGQMMGPFGPGRHTLDTKNLPLLTSVFSIPFGGKSPFTAEVWFVNKTMPLDVKWGTGDPIQLLDPMYNVMLPIRAFGQYGVQIDNTKKFLTKLVGTMPSFDRTRLRDYLRGMILTRAKDAIATQVVEEKTSLLHISTQLDELSERLKVTMEPELKEFGFKLVKFFVNSVNSPEDDPAVIQLKAALAKKAEMNIIGYTYQQERSFDSMEAAAGNPGSASSGMMGAGIGLGMGLGAGGAMGQAMGGMASQINLGSAMRPCPSCNAQVDQSAKFCNSCGSKMEAEPPAVQEATEDCGSCGATVSAGAKFCRECGKPMSADCVSCGVSLAGGAKFCHECGAKQEG